MAKDKVKKQPDRKKKQAKQAEPSVAGKSTPKLPKKRKAEKPSKAPMPPKAPEPSTASKVLDEAKSQAKKLAANPAVAEIVAASLVAAAAAIKNPGKARSMAASVGDELQGLSNQANVKNNAMWQLALDVARRTLRAVGEEKSAAAGGDKPKRPAKKKAKK